MSAVKALAKGAAIRLRNFLRMAAGTDDLSIREFVASRFLRGEGIEIGALDKPMPVPKRARVSYVDRMSNADLLEQYPDYRGKRLAPVEIIDDGQTLAKVPAASQDFVIANHFLEHCADPIRALQNMFRVLRDDGIIFLSIPDKRHTFDRDRPATPLAHVEADYREGPEGSRKEHFLEWARLVEKASGGAAEAMAEDLMRRDYSIHYHAWTQREILELALSLGRHLGFQPEIELAMRNGAEVVLVLSKGGAA